MSANLSPRAEEVLLSPLQMWSIAVVALFLKIAAVAMIQGYHRVRRGAYVKPEDAAFFGRGAEARPDELPIVARAQGALRNDGENIPIFLALSLAYVLLECWPGGTPWYLGGFVLGRALHSGFMIWPRQPHRNLCYSSGLLIMCAMSAHIGLHVFT